MLLEMILAAATTISPSDSSKALQMYNAISQGEKIENWKVIHYPENNYRTLLYMDDQIAIRDANMDGKPESCTWKGRAAQPITGFNHLGQYATVFTEGPTGGMEMGGTDSHAAGILTEEESIRAAEICNNTYAIKLNEAYLRE